MQVTAGSTQLYDRGKTATDNLIETLKNTDPDSVYFNYLRMTPVIFDDLLIKSSKIKIRKTALSHCLQDRGYTADALVCGKQELKKRMRDFSGMDETMNRDARQIPQAKRRTV